MRRLSTVVVLTLSLFVTVFASADARAEPTMTAPAIPDTPAGHTLGAWLDAFNSADPARIAAYHARYEPKGSADQTLSFRRRTGGFNLVAVDKSERLRIRFRVQERSSPRVGVGNIVVKDADPATVVDFGLRAIPPGMTAADLDIPVDAATRTRVLDGVAAKLTASYVYPAVAKQMVAAMRAHQKKGEYDAIVDGEDLAMRLTEDLKAVSHDGHLRVVCAPKIPPDPPDDADDDGPAPDADDRAEMQHENCAFQKVERLEHNVGYVKFDGFFDARVCAATVTAAMSFLSHVDAIIFDLRDNHGGDPNMVAYIASYLFDQRTHLNDLFQQQSGKRREFWTKPEVPGSKLGGKPVYVLTSGETFSAAEEFSYDLQNLKRATIVGETTGGGAHPTTMRRIDDHFAIGVPNARPINPVTKTDWEGKGVVPEVKVPAAQALETAQKLAAAALQKGSAPKH